MNGVAQNGHNCQNRNNDNSLCVLDIYIYVYVCIICRIPSKGKIDVTSIHQFGCRLTVVGLLKEVVATSGFVRTPENFRNTAD